MAKFLVIGYGIAGLCVARQLEKRGLEFKVIDNHFKNSSSRVAAGMWNPIGFKRLTKSWKVDEFLPYARSFYRELDQQLSQTFTSDHQLFRFFSSIEEENSWYEKLDDPRFQAYLTIEKNPKIENLKFKLKPPYAYGQVNQAGRVDISGMLKASKQRLIRQNQLEETDLGYQDFTRYEKGYTYQNEMYDHIIFCEGHQVLKNPFFKYLPLVPNKGEVFIVKIPGLNLENVINRGFFVLPLGNDLYKVGATFSSKDQSYEPTVEGKKWLFDKMSKLIDLPFELVDHHCGIRPTVPDRKPLIGTHDLYKGLHIFNGLGAKGVYLAPTLSRSLIDHILKDRPLPAEVNISRYKK